MLSGEVTRTVKKQQRLRDRSWTEGKIERGIKAISDWLEGGWG